MIELSPHGSAWLIIGIGFAAFGVMCLMNLLFNALNKIFYIKRRKRGDIWLK